jgi:hypothetical protein
MWPVYIIFSKNASQTGAWMAGRGDIDEMPAKVL